MHMTENDQVCHGAQVLVFVVFAATDARRASLEAHIPVSALLLVMLLFYDATGKAAVCQLHLYVDLVDISKQLQAH